MQAFFAYANNLQQISTFRRYTAMARKKNTPTAEDFRSAFPSRLRFLMMNSTNPVTQSDLGAAIGKTRQAVGYYQDGSSNPDWKTLVKIADYFNVSVDYLLGRTEVKSIEGDLRTVSEYTGLSEEAITAYLRINNLQFPDRPDLPPMSSVLSQLFCNLDFWQILHSLSAYAVDKATAPADYNELSRDALMEEYAVAEKSDKLIRDGTKGYFRVAAAKDVIDGEYAKANMYFAKVAESLVWWAKNDAQDKEEQ